MAGDGTYTLDGLAVPETLNLLHDLLDRVREDHADIGSEDLSMIETAIIEIAANVVEHGRPPGAVVYSFRLEVLPDRLEGLLRDSGAAPPDGLTGRPFPDDLAERGRGMALAEAALDELSYQRDGDANTWRLVRRRRDESSAPADESN
jgi:serine/threonine-protein kinase RsbW